MVHLKRSLWLAVIAMLIPAKLQAAVSESAHNGWSDFLSNVVEGEGQVLLLVFSVLVCVFVGCIIKNPEIH